MLANGRAGSCAQQREEQRAGKAQLPALPWVFQERKEMGGKERKMRKRNRTEREGKRKKEGNRKTKRKEKKEQKGKE